ncbi:Sister chromatid cohesion protein 2 [Knufia fluminis]|uniref:Sister chromatid cohesion protein n=1 Tax=Knufia fluminis TaxID=191047 RepID=A0AAN8EX31_9EURO|nr:Sister chromatid cohesion protein 2 [Knufia fluminis]
MAARPLIQVNVPPAPHRPNANHMNTIPGLSADKALQFTPFTTSILPAVDRIPVPEVSRVRENGRIATSSERKQAQTLLQQQDLQPVIRNQIAALLNQGATHIDFQLPPTPPSASPAPAVNLADLGLSPLARSVLSMTKIGYRYPTPPGDKENDTVVVHTPKHSSNQRLPTPADSTSPIARTQSVQQEIPRSQPLQKQPNGGLIVQILAPPPTYRREDYVTIQHSPKRRKVSHDGDNFGGTTTQRQQSDEALQSFQDLLTDIFEGQDRVDASGGNILNAKSEEYFESSDNEAEDGLTLNLRTLDKLREMMRKLLSLQRLRDVPVEELRRLQQICESSIERAQTINIRSDNHADQEHDLWRSSMLRANNSLCAAIAVIYIMLGNPQQEALLSPDLLRWSANGLVNVLESCLVPVIEARPDAKDSTLFKQASSETESIRLLLNSSRRLLELMATACFDVKGGESCVNTIEFLAAKLVFVQNATSEKNSVLGLQVYENFRKSAMASLSKMYARFAREREAILDEILSSLDKLPSTSRSARTFRAGDGKSIQLISALFMQLVQTTALHVPDKQRRKHKPKTHRTNTSDSADEEMIEEMAESDEDDEMDEVAETADSVARLNLKVGQLFTPAYREAQKIVLYLVNRASKTTKTGDSPYRSILDLLVEDLINVLENYEWPSAEILLNVLVVKMLDLAENEKTASAKNMALESLGTMASAISKLRVKSSTISNSLRSDNSKASTELVRLAQIHAEAGGISGPDLISLRGPFSMVIEHLGDLTGKVTLHQQSARGYFIAYFARLVSDALKGKTDCDLSDVTEHVLQLLASSMSESHSLGMDVSRDTAEAAYLLCVLNSGFCRRLTAMVKALSSSVTSDQAQVRSRSLKSVASILEIDSSLLDRDATIAEDVFRCASDDSAMVRDSALSLIARFVIPRGGVLQEKGMRRLLDCTCDEKIGVQKRSIGHLKEIYLQEHKAFTRKAIVLRFLLRLNDPEDSIVSLTEQTLQDILIKPALTDLAVDENSAAAKVAVEDLSSHLMNCVSEHYLPMLKKFFASLLRADSKGRSNNHRLCAKLVEALFEKVISTEKVESPLLVLTALAEADPRLVPAVHLSKLQIYLDARPGESTFMFRSAVEICRLVLPFLPETYKRLLKQTQDNLMKAITKMPGRLELDAIFQCLSTIDGVLHNTDRFFGFSKSILTGLQSPDTSTDGKVKAIPVDGKVKLVRILGAMGKHLDLDSHTEAFAKAVPNVRASSVSAHLATTLLPITAVERPLALREVALESVGSICQASPALFNDPEITKTLFDVLKPSLDSAGSDRSRLQAAVLNIFDELYAARAASKEKSDKAEEDDEQALKQMGGTAKSRDQDSAISAITMNVVDAVLCISLSEASANALPSARTLASISHQGLIHPKQCLGAFVAFGTSTDQQIAVIGHKAQQLLHQQHESHCEREYMSAIVQAFKYQAGVGEGPCGAIQTGQAGFRAKLGQCFEIITMSNSKYVKKFLSGLVSRMTIDTLSSDRSPVPLDHVAFTRFVVQNIAFFDYKKMDELLHVILQLELAYSKSGGEIAQAIEAAQMQYPDLVVHTQVSGNSELGLEPTTMETKSIDPALILELKRLSSAAATLMLMIETRSHLLRQYGIGRDVRTAMLNNKQAKETSKSPTKVHGITGEKLWTKSNSIVAALDDDSASVQLCKDFVAAMSVDEDFDMADDIPGGMDTAVDMDASTMKMSMTPSGRKRKLSATPGTTPTKRPRGRPRKNVQQQRRSRSASTDGDPDADFER